MRTIGRVQYNAAVFVYKQDGTEADCWRDIRHMRNDGHFIRGEVHDDKEVFLNGLTKWNRRLEDPANSFLCIYAHMGPLGINSFRRRAATRITWDELADCVPQGVALLWLLGCNSTECMASWQGFTHPVRHILLATIESMPFQPLLKVFAEEIDMDNITPFNEMPQRVRQANPALGRHTRYFTLKFTRLRRS